MYSHTQGTQRQHRQEVKEEGEKEKRSDRGTRLTRALAPYSLDRAAVGDPEGSRGSGPKRPGAQANSSERAAGGVSLPTPPGAGPLPLRPLGGRGIRAGASHHCSKPAPGAPGKASGGGRAPRPSLPAPAAGPDAQWSRPAWDAAAAAATLPSAKAAAATGAGRRNRSPEASPAADRRAAAAPFESVLGAAPLEFRSPEPAPRGASASSATGRRGYLSRRPPFRCCPQEAFGDTLTRARIRRSRAPSGRKVAGAPTARGSLCPVSEMRAAAAERAARDSARWGRPRCRGRRCRPRASPPPPRWVRKRRAGPGRWMPPVAQRSPAPRAQPGSRGRCPPRLPRLCSAGRPGGSQPQQLGNPFPTRGTLFK